MKILKRKHTNFYKAIWEYNVTENANTLLNQVFEVLLQDDVMRKEENGKECNFRNSDSANQAS